MIFETNIARYHYEQSGNGEAVIFAHGLFVDHTVFEHQTASLQKDYTCYSLDLPGHGKSTFNPAGWILEDIAEDFRQFITEKQIHKPTVVGLSQGGMIFIRLAAKYPELIGRLVLVGSSHQAEPLERIPLWKERIEILRNGSKVQIDKMITSVQKMIVGSSFFDKHPELQQKELKIMQRNNPEVMIPATEAAVIKRKDVFELLPKITCPTLIVCGTEDHATPKEVAEIMQQNILGSQLEIIEDAGHHVPIEKAEEFTCLLLRFLRDNKI